MPKLHLGGLLLFCALALGVHPAAATDRDAMRAALQQIADDYLSTRGEPEHISAVSISVLLPGGQDNLNVVAGRVARAADAAPVTPATLFQIGSITKSFTSAALLQLQAEKRLRIDQPLGELLPEYPAWKEVTLRRLLHMTSGIPGYDNSPAMLKSMAAVGLDRHWTPPVLVGFADPTYPDAMTPTTGWNYSNTNYILAGMIIERVTGHPYALEITERFLGERLGLTATYYSPDTYPDTVTARLAAGYFWSRDPENAGLAKLLGRDVSRMDMSWAGAAGGIVATPRDVTRWVAALYQSPLLAAPEREALLSIVSNKTGQPIAATSAADPLGFGLGVAQFTKALMGTGWYYQGETLGFRVLYVYIPADGIIFAVGLNSQPSDAENKAGDLITNIHAAVAAHR